MMMNDSDPMSPSNPLLYAFLPSTPWNDSDTISLNDPVLDSFIPFAVATNKNIFARNATRLKRRRRQRGKARNEGLLQVDSVTLTVWFFIVAFIAIIVLTAYTVRKMR